MARVTVEDCIEKVENRFELVLMAARRAKDIERGATPSVARDNDKPTIIALREIAEETISLNGLEELTKRGLIEDKDLFINGIEADEKFLERDDDDVGEVFEGDEEIENMEEFDDEDVIGSELSYESENEEISDEDDEDGDIV